MPNQHVVKLLSELVAIDSQSSKSNEPIISLLQKWFEKYEQTVQTWVRDDGVKGKNLIVKIPGKSSDSSVVFVCHMDTVPPSDAWETDPFILEDIEGKLYGLGACDTKGGIAAIIEAVLTLQEKPSNDTYLVFDGDEESSTTGAKKFAKTFALPNPQFIFIEPTDQQLVISQKSLLKFAIKTVGTSIHASQATPDNNGKHNAIYKMGKILEVLTKDAQQLHPHCTQNFGMIHGGTAVNVLANSAYVTVDRRLDATLDAQKEIQRLTALLQAVDTTVQITEVEIEPGFATSQNSPFVQEILKHIKKYIPSIEFGVFPAWSEAGLFNKYKDVVVMGPGSLVHQAHRANEYVEGKELLQYVDIFTRILI